MLVKRASMSVLDFDGLRIFRVMDGGFHYWNVICDADEKRFTGFAVHGEA